MKTNYQPFILIGVVVNVATVIGVGFDLIEGYRVNGGWILALCLGGIYLTMLLAMRYAAKRYKHPQGDENNS